MYLVMHDFTTRMDLNENFFFLEVRCFDFGCRLAIELDYSEMMFDVCDTRRDGCVSFGMDRGKAFFWDR